MHASRSLAQLDRMRPLRRTEYDRLVSAGVFEGERLELIDGVIVRMSPRDASHFFPIEQLTELLVKALAGRARVRIQAPLALSDDAEPEPDVAIVARHAYTGEHPSTALLVIEVANTSVDQDRDKCRLYATAEIPEYWIVDVQRRHLERYTKPSGGAYANLTTHEAGETLHPEAFPDIAVPVSEILPPVK